MERNIQGLDTLEAWKKAKAFALLVYREVLPVLPPEEKWSLGQQIRRAAQSIPANIAEGQGRYYFQETVRYCYIARGSLTETYSHIVLAHELGYLPADTFEEVKKQMENLARTINGYIAYLKRARIGANEPGSKPNPHS